MTSKPRIGTAQEAFMASRIDTHYRRVAGELGIDGFFTNVGPDAGTDAWISWKGNLRESRTLIVKDWVQLGQGASRACWLSPISGVAYKVERRPSNRWSANADEFETYLARWSNGRSKKFRAPKMHLFRLMNGFSVLATETVKGTPDWNYAHDEALNRYCEAHGMWDVHPWNILIQEDGSKVIIDL